MTEGTADLALEDSPKLNTAQLMALLRAKYPRDRYAMFFDVPDAVMGKPLNIPKTGVFGLGCNCATRASYSGCVYLNESAREIHMPSRLQQQLQELILLQQI